MTGQIFSDVATYTAQVVTADVFGASDAERLIAEGYLKDPGMIAVVLVPVIAGMFFGVLMLASACWRSALPKAPVVALALWPLWDFFGPGPVGPFSGELLLLVAGVWLGVAVARLPRQRVAGRNRLTLVTAAAILHVWLRDTPASSDHPAALAAWVIAAGSTLIGLTAVFIGPQ